MKVLLVSHRYPPTHLAGTELYTAGLAAELLAAGHEVLVFTTEKDIARPHLSVSEREHQGVRVVELVNNLHYSGLRETWDLAAVDEAFERALRAFAPDVVHLHHLLYLSVGVAERAAAFGAPVVFTLHDYWLACARFGQRVHADGTICHTIEAPRCASCLSSFRFANSPLEQRVAGWVAGLRSATGVDLTDPLRRAGDWLRGRESGDTSAAPDPGALAALEADVREREAGLRERLCASVDRFLSPSAFLRERMVEWGVPSERIEHMPTGVDSALFGKGERPPRGSQLRVGYLGSLVPVKGVHVLLEAWAALPEGLRAEAELACYGPKTHDVEYEQRLSELARAGGAELRGALPRERVPALLRELDLLVVPSVWYENQPLVILEALAAGTPLLVSDLGGMAELVEEGVSGWRFPVGDVGALSAELSRLIAAPEQLEALPRTAHALPTPTEQAAAILAVYEELLRAR